MYKMVWLLSQFPPRFDVRMFFGVLGGLGDDVVHGRSWIGGEEVYVMGRLSGSQ
jgi:hypothetical protein